MDSLTELLRLAERRGIPVCRVRLPLTGSLCLQDESLCCYIGLDEDSIQTTAEQSVHLAHEVGHCVTGSFYNRYAPCDLRQKHENRADRWAIQRLIDPARLCDALDAGVTEPWELAEYFDVTEPFMRKALAYYLPAAREPHP